MLVGVDIDFAQPLEAPCRDCGKMVDLSSEITFNIVNTDGSESKSRMSEANARALLAQVGIPSPPVLCDQDAWVENEIKLP